MNWLDVALVLAIVISTVNGFAAGFARAGIGFLATVLGLIFGLQYYRPVSLTLRDHIVQSNIANVVGFLIIFCGITIVGSVAAGILSRFFRNLRLAWLDRLLGGAFGVVRGLLFATITIWALMAFLPAGRQLVLSESRLAPRMMDAASMVAAASSEDVRRNFRESYRQLKKVLPENIKNRLSTLPQAQI